MPRAKLDDRGCRKGSLLRIYDWVRDGSDLACCPYCGRKDIEVNIRFDSNGQQILFLAEHNLPIPADHNGVINKPHRPIEVNAGSQALPRREDMIAGLKV